MNSQFLIDLVHSVLGLCALNQAPDRGLSAKNHLQTSGSCYNHNSMVTQDSRLMAMQSINHNVIHAYSLDPIDYSGHCIRE